MGGQRAKAKEYERHPYTIFLRRRLMVMGKNATQLHEESNLSMATISFLLNGNQLPSTISNPTHQAISDVLRVPMATLLRLAGYNLYRHSEEDLSEIMRELEAAAKADVQFYLNEPNDVPMG